MTENPKATQGSEPAKQPPAGQGQGQTSAAPGASSTISQVHLTPIDVSTIELTPPHPPRVETPEYKKAHDHLVIELDTACKICGVRNSTLKDAAQNPFNAQALETHHYPIERSLVDACDPKKVAIVFPQVKDRDMLNAFVDSEANLLVLCDVHHRSIQFGIHHLTVQDFFIQQFLFAGYQVVANQQNAAQVEAQDARVVAVGAQVTTQDGMVVSAQAQVIKQGSSVVEAQAEVTVSTQGSTVIGAQAQEEPSSDGGEG